MKWCCIGFRSLYNQIGERGFAVVVEHDEMGQLRFVLQHRAIDKSAPTPSKYDHPISLVSDLRVHYCPSCGCKLAKHYRRGFDTPQQPGMAVPL